MAKGRMGAAKHHVRRVKNILDKDTGLRERLETRNKALALMDKYKRWDLNPPSLYNNSFLKAFGRSAVDVLAGLKRQGKPLRIFEEGPGDGDFLAALKRGLESKGIDSMISAITLHATKGLKDKVEASLIDKLVVEPAELYVPDEPQDAIISMVGSLTHTLSPLKREHLLKFAKSLRKGGIMLIGLAGSMATPKLSKLPIREQIPAITRALEKNGFEAEFYLRRSSELKFLPPVLVKIKRIR